MIHVSHDNDFDSNAYIIDYKPGSSVSKVTCHELEDPDRIICLSAPPYRLWSPIALLSTEYLVFIRGG